jgi:predicted metal-dependent enzyme (double-stranded beta helix superfamily)
MPDVSQRPAAIAELMSQLDGAVGLGHVEQITERVKHELQRFSRSGLTLPERFRQSSGDSYARRLLHRAPGDAYTVVVMAWGPRQHTELHDHAGIWCVECVLEGQLDVRQYDLVEQHGDRYRFVERKQVRAGVGEAGCLIPPFEYHVLGNALDDRTTITLHVYGGEMDHCNCYRPQAPGWWHKSPKRLEYSA